MQDTRFTVFAAPVLAALILISGCVGGTTDPSEVDASPVRAPQPTMDWSNITVDPPHHAVSFEAAGVVPLGTRGYYVVCGGLKEQGIEGYDTREHEWELPAVEKADFELVPASAVLNFTIGDNHVYAELALWSPSGQEIARIASTLGPGSDPVTLDAQRLPGPGTYAVQVRSCTGYNGEYQVEGSATYGAAGA